MHPDHATFQTHAFDFWLARGAVALIAGLQLLFVNNNLIFGPRWLAPAFELAMLVPLSVATVWTQGKVRQAHADDDLALAEAGLDEWAAALNREDRG